MVPGRAVRDIQVPGSPEEDRYIRVLLSEQPCMARSATQSFELIWMKPFRPVEEKQKKEVFPFSQHRPINVIVLVRSKFLSFTGEQTSRIGLF